MDVKEPDLTTLLDSLPFNPMTFETYDQVVKDLAVYPRSGKNLTYAVLGLAGEAGEVANKTKKIDRDSEGTLTPEARQELIAELGDTLWYLSACARELGVDLNLVANLNLNKLISRKIRGTLHGEGDNR